MSGVVAGFVSVYAPQVPAVGAVSGTHQDGRQYAGGLPPVRRQGRSQRHSGAADHPVMPSRPVTAPEAGYGRDAPVATAGGTAPADGQSEDAAQQPSDRVLEAVLSADLE